MGDIYLAGPIGHWEGNKGKGHFDPASIKGNFYAPSKSTRTKYQSGYTTGSGLYNPLLKAFLLICDHCLPLINTPLLKVYPSSLQNDETALKAGLRFDERLKKIVGLIGEISNTLKSIHYHLHISSMIILSQRL